MKNRLILFVLDALLITASFVLAANWFGLEQHYWILLAFFLIAKLFLYVRFGLYHAILRYAGLPLAIAILKASIISSLFCFFLIHFPSPQKISVGFFATDFLMTTFWVGLARFAPRYFVESWREWGPKRVLIYGAGQLGEEVARKLIRIPGDYRLVGFVDDDPSKTSKKLHNLPIFGTGSQLHAILARHRISELIIAISSLTGEAVRKITHECRRNHVFCRIVPSFANMLKKDINIKNIDISDLLKRKPKDLDEPQIQRFIKDKVVLITGAGGSIGSELSRQCILYGAKKLILIDHSEFNLYQLQEELSSNALPLRFCLLNVLDSRLEKVFAEEKPSVVFHASAYKHVPMVEENPCEGVINNVEGTLRTAQLADKYQVEKFVLISTDKAVRPTSIMGASKRIAELYIQNFNTKSRTEFIAVRFGNVLGSSGSVIPKFIEQINQGGPVTVTHPEVTRYFMLINEAVQLVLQAASIGNGGEIFILNMGQPVRIADMAEDLIFLAGLEPQKDIKIEFSGLRPGEKLYEELLIDESEKKTQYENITIGRATYLDWNYLSVQLDHLLQAAKNNDPQEMVRKLRNLVSEYSGTHFCNDQDFSPSKILPLRSLSS